jgi:hypothetical protein
MNSKKKPLDVLIRLSGVGIQMGLTLYLAAYFGKKLDLYFGFERLWTSGLVLVAFVLSMISLLQQLKKLQDKS